MACSFLLQETDKTATMIEMVQAVLLVGREGGSTGLYPLTSPALPRALLPVANKPMISYSLATLESAGITNVFVVRFHC